MAKKEDSHGYDAQFCPELEKKYQCPVCLGGLREPVQTRCGHRFCKNCLTKTFKSVRFSKCPVDNTWIDTQKEIFVDTAVKREVLSLTVLCSNKSNECDWKGELRDLQKHERTCPDGMTECPNNCKKKIKRRHLQKHKDDCPLRVLSCPHCDNSVVYQDMTKHQVLVCMKFPVNCTVCGETGILREDIPQHVDLMTGNCPLVTVKCAFYHIGCYFQDKRKNMSLHYRDSYHQHMMMLACKLMQQEEHLQRQRLEVREATETCARLTILTQEQQNQLEEQQRVLSRHEAHIDELNTTSFNGRLLWAIDANTSQTEVCSPAFYTGKPGYKLRILLTLEKKENKEDNFVLHVELLKGKNDEQLVFPYNSTGILTILNPRSATSVVTEIDCPGLTLVDTSPNSAHYKDVLTSFTRSEMNKFSSEGRVLISVEINVG